MDEEKIRQIVRAEVDKLNLANYRAGTPQIPPHTHNNVDNLPITLSNTIGTLPASRITNLPVATGTATLPGGVSGDIQINAAGAFGTIKGLNLDQTGNARGANALDIQSARNAVTQVAGGKKSVAIGAWNTASNTYNISIGFQNNNTGSGYATAIGVNNTVSGYEAMASGYNNTASGAYSTASGAYNSASGSSSVAVGVHTTASNTAAVAVGKSVTASGNSSSVFGSGSTASATDSVAIGNGVSTNQSGSLILGSNNASAALYLNNSKNFAFIHTNNPNPTFGGGVGVIFIGNDTTDPSTTPTGGGILYVTAGALNYMGTSGTVTPLAPA